MTRRSRTEYITPTTLRRASDLPPIWMAARARNALRRPVLIGGVGVGAFLVALVALVVIPKEAHRAARAVAPAAEERRDTIPLLRAVAVAQRSLQSAESTLMVARNAPAPVIPTLAVDTMPPEVLARRDSLATIIGELSRGLDRVENAPLASSYRALGELPPLRDVPRVRELLDSLAEVERERETFGAIGGIDPTFVTLTARATTIGRSIQEVAEGRRGELRRELSALTPAPPPRPAARRMVDTVPLVTARDAVRQQLLESIGALRAARRNNADVERRAQRARELANVGVPPLAMLAAALVFGAVVGFATALGGELRLPRLADRREAERLTGERVLAVIRPYVPPPDRARRRADREAPPLIESGADSYRLLYYEVAPAGANLVMVSVTGDEPAITATVAANIAALASHEARTTLLIDADLATSAVAGVMRVHPTPGLHQIVDGAIAWPEAIAPVVVGRDRSVDVIPAGERGEPRYDELSATLGGDLARLARRYDAVVLAVAAEHAMSDLPTVLPIPDVVYCARLGITPVSTLTAAVTGLKLAGARVRGVVLWDMEQPHVPVGEELAEALRSGLYTTDSHPVPSA